MCCVIAFSIAEKASVGLRLQVLVFLRQHEWLLAFTVRPAQVVSLLVWIGHCILSFNWFINRVVALADTFLG